MAKFKNSNLQLKTNQEILLGDSQEVSITYDGSSTLINPSSGGVELYFDGSKVFETDSTGVSVLGDLKVEADEVVDGTMKVFGHSAIGNADIDYPGFPTYERVLNIRDIFGSGVTDAGYGLTVGVENLANGAFTTTAGIAGGVQNNTSTQHYLLLGGDFFANTTADSATVDSVIGVRGNAAGVGDNSTITQAVGGDFYTVTSFGISNSSTTTVIGGRFQILKWGSGDLSITDGYGALIKTPGYNPTGTTTNLYGLYIEDQSTVGFTNDYNIYSAGSNSTNKFEGDVEVDGHVEYNPNPASDLTGTGDVIQQTVESNSYGVSGVLTIDSTTGLWVEGDATDEERTGMLAMALESGTGTKKLLLRGIMRNDSWNWTPNDQLYVSDQTPGAITNQAPGTGNFLQVVGYAMTADTIYFNPSPDYAEVG